MSDALKKVTRGESLADLIQRGEGPFNAAWFNQSIDAITDANRARRTLDGAGSKFAPPPLDGDDYFLNNSGADLDQYAIVGLGSLLDTPVSAPGTLDDREQLFRDETNWNSAAPAAGEPFGITQEPVPSTEIGRVLVTGRSKCRVLVNNVNDRFAGPLAGNYTHLSSSPTGPAEILWPKPFSATGEQWAIVRVDAKLTQNRVFRIPLTAGTYESGSYSRIINGRIRWLYYAQEAKFDAAVSMDWIDNTSGLLANPSGVGNPPTCYLTEVNNNQVSTPQAVLARFVAIADFGDGPLPVYEFEECCGCACDLPDRLCILVNVGSGGWFGSPAQTSVYVDVSAGSGAFGFKYGGSITFLGSPTPIYFGCKNGVYVIAGLFGAVVQIEDCSLTSLVFNSFSSGFGFAGQIFAGPCGRGSGTGTGTGTGSGGGGGGGISRASLGSAHNAALGVTLDTGSLLIVNIVTGNNNGSPSAISWNGHALSKATNATFLNGSGFFVDVSIWYLDLTGITGATALIVPTVASGGYAFSAVEVTGLASNTRDLLVGAIGTSATPDSGTSGTTSAANEYVQAAMTVSGAVPGTWQNGFARGQAWDSDTVNYIDEGYRVLSATGTVDAAQIIATSEQWAMICAAFK